jgi:hypothetical protein
VPLVAEVLIMAPVSMPTGQASLQVESPAQVSTAS